MKLKIFGNGGRYGENGGDIRVVNFKEIVAVRSLSAGGEVGRPAIDHPVRPNHAAHYKFVVDLMAGRAGNLIERRRQTDRARLAGHQDASLRGGLIEVNT